MKIFDINSNGDKMCIYVCQTICQCAGQWAYMCERVVVNVQVTVIKCAYVLLILAQRRQIGVVSITLLRL